MYDGHIAHDPSELWSVWEQPEMRWKNTDYIDSLTAHRCYMMIGDGDESIHFSARNLLHISSIILSPYRVQNIRIENMFCLFVKQ